MKAPPLILASASPRRSELLARAGYTFTVKPSAAEEIHQERLTAGEIARLNAALKARVIAVKHPNAVTLGVDTVVVSRGIVYGKPADLAEAARMIQALQGRTHQVVTGVCLMHPQSGRVTLFDEQTDVTFHRMTPERIRRYHAEVNPLDKAGAYGIQEKSVALVKSYEGSFSNVAGLPMERLGPELAVFGIRPRRKGRA